MLVLDSVSLNDLVPQWFSGLVTHSSHLGAQTNWMGISKGMTLAPAVAKASQVILMYSQVGGSAYLR